MPRLTVSIDHQGTGMIEAETLRKSGIGNRLSLISSFIKSLAGNTITRLGEPLIEIGGSRSTGTVTFSVAPAANADKVTIGGRTYTFKTAPAVADDLALGATFAESAENLAAAINNSGGSGYYATTKNALVEATVLGGVVTLTSLSYGVVSNLITLAKTGTNIAVSGVALSGGLGGEIV